MPTEKPRVTFTICQEKLEQVDSYRFENKFKNQTQAILSLIDRGLSNPPAERNPRVSDEALKLALDYDRLDKWGQKQVRDVACNEVRRVQETHMPDMEFVPARSFPQQPEMTLGGLLEFSRPVTPAPKLPKARKRRDGFVEIKVYDQPAAAGLGNYLDEPDHHVEQYPNMILPDKTDFGILISGNSMEPLIHDRSTVFVQASVSIPSGRIGIFRLNNQAYCKRLVVDKESREVRLVSENKQYHDIVVMESDDFRTVGLVLGQWPQR